MITVEVAAFPAAAPKIEKVEKTDNKDAKDAPKTDAPKLEAPKASIIPYELVDGTGDITTVALSGGSDGNVMGVTPTEYIGSDNGPGKRSGLAAFAEIPGCIDYGYSGCDRSRG